MKRFWFAFQYSKISPVLHQIFSNSRTWTIILVFTQQIQSSCEIKRVDFTEVLLPLTSWPLKIACHKGAFDMLHIFDLTSRPSFDLTSWQSVWKHWDIQAVTINLTSRVEMQNRNSLALDSETYHDGPLAGWAPGGNTEDSCWCTYVTVIVGQGMIMIPADSQACQWIIPSLSSQLRLRPVPDQAESSNVILCDSKLISSALLEM